MTQIYLGFFIFIVWTIPFGGAAFFLSPHLGFLAFVAITGAFGALHILLPLLRGQRRKAAALRLRPLGANETTLAGALLVLPFIMFSGWHLSSFFFSSPEPTADLFDEYAAQGALAAVIFFAVAPTAIIEECCFRGWIQGALERHLPGWIAIFLASAAFTLVHFQADGAPYFFLLGVIFGEAARSTGSILAPIILHSVHNVFYYLHHEGVVRNPLDLLASQNATLALAVSWTTLGASLVVLGWMSGVARRRRRAVVASRPKLCPAV